MNKKRQLIFNKFNGLCAYTGKPLGEDWQVDHLEPVIRKMKIQHGYYKNMATGNKATEEEIKEYNRTENTLIRLERIPNKLVPDGFHNPENNCIDNLVPALRIINHYKSSHSLESFRKYILTLHERLKKLPKNTSRTETLRRIDYLKQVANAFDIATDKPFNGKFYFETINK